MAIGLSLVVLGLGLMWLPQLQARLGSWRMVREARRGDTPGSRAPAAPELVGGALPARIEVWGQVSAEAVLLPASHRDVEALRRSRRALAIEVRSGLLSASALERRFSRCHRPTGVLPTAAEAPLAPPPHPRLSAAQRSAQPEISAEWEATGAARAALHQLQGSCRQARAAIRALEAGPGAERWAQARACVRQMGELAAITEAAEANSRVASLVLESKLLSGEDRAPAEALAGTSQGTVAMPPQPLDWQRRPPASAHQELRSPQPVTS